MPEYTCKVANEEGKVITLNITADSYEAAKKQLTEKGYFIFEIRKQSFKFNLFKGRSNLSELIIFSKQLSVLTESGISIIESLQIIANQIKNPHFKNIIAEISSSVSTGNSLSDSMAKYPHVFSNFYINTLRAGEKSGSLSEVLNQLIRYMEYQNKLRKKIKGAMIYPLILFIFSIIVVSFLLIKVVPTFRKIFQSSGASMPGPTLILLNISHFLTQNFYSILISLFILILLLYSFKNTRQGQLTINKLMLGFPVFKNLIWSYVTIQFSNTLYTLLKAGITVPEALPVVVNAIENREIAQRLQGSMDKIKTGTSMTESLKETNSLPEIALQLITAGEKTGQMTKMLLSITKYYEDEVEDYLSRIQALIEPILMLFIGIVVGGIVLTMFLPILEMSSLVR